ncbi:MAG: urease accessory protein UreE [Bauldia litoralis]
MDRATLAAASGTWPRGDAVATVTLDYQDRCRRRMRLVADGGLAFLLDLAEAGVLADGDGLRLEDGRWIGVRAAPERLTRVDCADPHHRTVIAWHLGNRHLPTEIAAEAIYIRHDHVIEAMLEGLGATLTSVERPFTPESGAYAAHRHAAHAHDHEHSAVEGAA